MRAPHRRSADVRDLVVAPNGQVIVAAASDSADRGPQGRRPRPRSRATSIRSRPPTTRDDEEDEEDDDEEDDTADDEERGRRRRGGRREDEEPANPNVAKCTPAKGLSGVSGLALSRDGKSLFANSGGYVTAFNRDTNSGALTEFGCLETYPYYKSCGEAAGFDSITTTSDGRNLYAATYRGSPSSRRRWP